MLRLAGGKRISQTPPGNRRQADVLQPRAYCRTGCWRCDCECAEHDDLFLLEVATYPERRVEDQLMRDLNTRLR